MASDGDDFVEPEDGFADDDLLSPDDINGQDYCNPLISIHPIQSLSMVFMAGNKRDPS